MTPKVNYILSQLRPLAEQAAWGPEIPVRKTDFTQGVGGTGEAVNGSNAQDMLDFYIDNICQALVDEFGISEDEAYDYIMESAEEMADSGMLPELPSENDSDVQVSMFLGTAKSLGFEGYCIKLVRDKLASVESPRRSENMPMDYDGLGMDHDDNDFGDFDNNMESPE